MISQSPAAGSTLRFGGKVNLVVAQAPKEVAVPLVVGQTEAQAAAALGERGLHGEDGIHHHDGSHAGRAWS